MFFYLTERIIKKTQLLSNCVYNKDCVTTRFTQTLGVIAGYIVRLIWYFYSLIKIQIVDIIDVLCFLCDTDFVNERYHNGSFRHCSSV